MSPAPGIWERMERLRGKSMEEIDGAGKSVSLSPSHGTRPLDIQCATVWPRFTIHDQISQTRPDPKLLHFRPSHDEPYSVSYSYLYCSLYNSLINRYISCGQNVGYILNNSISNTIRFIIGALRNTTNPYMSAATVLSAKCPNIKSII